MDPLFHKTSAAFDEGGSGGLLLNHLFVKDDLCELLLDSSVAMTTRDVTTSGQTSQDSAMIDLSELRGRVLWNSLSGYFLKLKIITVQTSLRNHPPHIRIQTP